MSTLDKRGETLRRQLGLVPNLLVVDADEDARQKLTYIARAEGFSVHQTADTDIAMRLLGIGGISVLATDLQVNAEFDGLKLLETARSRWPLLPLVAVSRDLAPFPGVLPIGTRFAGKPYRERRLARLLRAAALQSGRPG